MTDSNPTPSSDPESEEQTPNAEPAESLRPSRALLDEVYDQLRAIAKQRMSSERKGHTLQATALVHEAYLRLIRNEELDWSSPGHFYVAASEAMRRILIDHARKRNRKKRSGGKTIIRSVVDLAQPEASEEVLALDEALQQLEQARPRRALVVRLRFYAGLSVEETADALGMSVRTVEREWTTARKWLHEALTQ
ncbi:MAG: ECF-type sigma factor [Planctomycetota bacterium]